MKSEVNQYVPPIGYDKLIESVDYGTISKVEYYSKNIKTKRKFNIWLPANYNENKKYPVLYLLHGIGGDENEWLNGGAQYIIGNLMATKNASEMIIIFPNVRARQDDSANPGDIFTLEHFKAFDNFINDLLNDLIPYVEKNYSVKLGRENTAIAWLSMGGREALYIGFTLYKIFGYIGAFCPAFGIFKYLNNGVFEEGLFTEENFKIPQDLKTLIMIVKGKDDSIVMNEPIRQHNTLVKNNVNHIYYEIEGGHDFTVWNHGLYNFLKRIFKDY